MTRSGGLFRSTARDTAAAEAAIWLARYRLGTIDQAAFQIWRDGDAANALAFARALAGWESASGGTRDAMAVAPLPVSGAALSRRTFLRAAAVAVTATGLITTTRAYAWSSASTEVGENKGIRLPDGSTAELNTNSRLSWRFSARERTLWIERGEVALDLRGGPVAVVRSADRQVSLSQGRFNVRRRDAALDLLVLAGMVRVTGDNQAPGAIVDARKGPSSVLVSQNDAVIRHANAEQVDGITAWQHNEILFQDTTLGSAVDEYNRFLTRKIVIVDRELSSIPIGGRFTTNDPAPFLQAISTSLNVHVSRSSTTYLLTR